MRAAVYYHNSRVELEERPRPVIGSGELLMRVRASGICGSDVMEWYRVPRAPIVLGHEVAGTVEEAGAGVGAFRPGDRIVTTHHVPCMTCKYCLSGRQSVCPTLHATTFDPGGFAEFVRLPAANVERGTFLLPDSVSFEEGSFVEPLACAIRGQRLMGLVPGDAVLVLGSGVSGILHTMLARATGAARVLATDVHDARLDAVRRAGADAAFRADAPDLEAEVRRANGGRLPERVVVCAASRDAMEQALRLVDAGGSVLFFATVPPGESLTLSANELWKSGIAIVHSYAGPPAEMAQALALIAGRRVDVASMITHRLGLADTALGFRLMIAGGASLKVVIDPTR